MLILKILTATLQILFGIVAILRPQQVAGAVGLQLKGKLGETEIRSSWGGLYIAMGIMAIILRDPSAFTMFGALFAGTFIVRLVAVAMNRQLLNRTTMIILAYEAISAMIFLAPL